MILTNNARVRCEAALHADCPRCKKPITWSHRPGPVTEWRSSHDDCGLTFALVTETVLTMVMDEHGNEMSEDEARISPSL